MYILESWTVCTEFNEIFHLCRAKSFHVRILPLSDACMATRASIGTWYSFLSLLRVLKALRIHVLYLHKQTGHTVICQSLIRTLQLSQELWPSIQQIGTHSRKRQVAVSADNALAHLRDVLDSISSSCQMIKNIAIVNLALSEADM